jgi:hypothetical protein
MNTTIAAVMLVAIVGVVVSNVAVMIAGLPCAFAVIGIAAWEERRERRS